MSADGTTALVGAWGDQTGTCSEAGEAYVFRRTAEGWDTSNSTTLPNPDPSERDQFGNPVALSADGTTALVDANKATYVFRQTAAGWDTDNPVTLPDPSDFPSQDVAVSADGTTALIGVRREETAAGMDVGVAYVFRRTDEEWNTDNPVTLPNPDAEPKDQFGRSVALNADGTTALIGAPGEYTNDRVGAAYVFNWTAEGWDVSNPITLPNPDPTDDDAFGWSVAMNADGTTALVGGYWATTGPECCTGAAYVFNQTVEGWNTQNPAMLPNPDPDYGDFFGWDVVLSVDGKTALIGTPQGETAFGDVGQTYVFRRTDEGWNTDNPITLPNPDPDHHDYFGTSVAVNADGTSALVGAPLDDTAAGENVGAAYLFEREAQSLISADQGLTGDTITEPGGSLRR